MAKEVTVANRSVRNALARALMEGYDENVQQMRFALDTANLVLAHLSSQPFERVAAAVGIATHWGSDCLDCGNTNPDSMVCTECGSDEHTTPLYIRADARYTWEEADRG